MGFFIPIPIVRHFLDEPEGRSLRRLSRLGPRHDAAALARVPRERGLPPRPRRRRGRPRRPGGTFDGVLRPGDVLLSVDGTRSPTTARSALGDSRVTFEHALDMMQVGQKLRFSVWRDGREQVLTASARRIARYDRSRNRYGVAPHYVVYAGLVFMPLEIAAAEDARPRTGRRRPIATWSGTCCSARPSSPSRPTARSIVLTRVLRHAVNSQMALNPPVAVDKINGRPIRSLAGRGGGLRDEQRALPPDRVRGRRPASRRSTARRPTPRRPRS